MTDRIRTTHLHRTRRTAIAVAGLAVAATALTACGSSGSSASSSNSPSGAMSGMTGMSASPSTGSSSGGGSSTGAAMITIKNYGYSGTSTVKAGATVMVKNDDSVAHTVTADKGSAFDVNVKPGATATFKAPAKAGTYTYHCTYHAEMHGTLTVS
jgi:plastocyanin